MAHSSLTSAAAGAEARPTLERLRVPLGTGAETTVHVARFSRSRFRLRVHAIGPMATVRRWCEDNDADHAIVGGFYVRPGGPGLGDLWVDGEAVESVPFDAPWHDLRACVHSCDGRVTIAPRHELGPVPRGDLLHAGPMLVAGGRSQIREGIDAEGFSAGARQFDSDITDGRYPRSALGLSATELIAVVCDGRADEDAGMTMAELAEAMLALGAESAMNLDGGGSASLVVGRTLVNTPREEHGLELVGGREVATVLQFAPSA